MNSPNITRRALFGSVAAGVLASSRLSGATFSKPLGVQLYTLRKVMPDAAEATLKAVAEIGYKEVEVLHADLERISPMLKANGLKPVSCHYDGSLITGNWKAWPSSAPLQAKYGDALSAWKAMVEEAQKYGIEYMVFPYVRPDERGDAASYERMADQMNKAGAACKAGGRVFCYHNHAFEFKGEQGSRAIDIFKAKTDPKLVNLELDVFWVSVAGHDPVQMMQEWKGRIPLVHLKDKESGVPTLYEEGKVKPENFKEVGNGSLNFAAILKQAPKSGVKHYFVEQDQTPGDPLTSLKQSYQNLRKVDV